MGGKFAHAHASSTLSTRNYFGTIKTTTFSKEENKACISHFLATH